MSVIEDGRKLMQDFLAPELRAISVRVEALEKKVDEVDGRAEKRHVVALAKIDDVDRRTDKRHAEILGIIGDLERRTDKRFAEVLGTIGDLERRTDKRFEHVDKHFEQMDKRFEQMDKRFEQMDKHIDARFDQLLSAIGTIADYNALRDRVARLETGDRPHQ